MRFWLAVLLVLTAPAAWAQDEQYTMDQARALCREYLEDGHFDREEEQKLLELSRRHEGKVGDFFVLVSHPVPVEPLWTGGKDDWVRLLSVATLAPAPWERLREFGARKLFEAWDRDELEAEVDRIQSLLGEADPWTRGYGHLLLIQSLETLQNNVSSRLPEFEGLEVTGEFQAPR